MNYRAPIMEQRFVLEVIADLPALAALPKFEAVSPDLAETVLEAFGRLAAGTFSPLNSVGDRQGARWSELGVVSPPGFADAYRVFCNGGWGSLTVHADLGGQGLPFVLGCAVQEQLASANMAFSLCPMLTQGAVEALRAHASEDVKAAWLPKLVAGEWTGTMALTEPQAGSDLGSIRTRAQPDGNGGYLINGTKIFITWGEHDLTDNIVHLVLARLSGAPPGSRGLSLFLVPKIWLDGAHNDVRCVAIEQKLGIHASPTCTLVFGDVGRCRGLLIGPEHEGLKAMFTMMNHARVQVGLQGVAIAERARQAALAYAGERVQAHKPISFYPDVRRMLMTMRALTQGARALAYYTASAIDRSYSIEGEESQFNRDLADLLTPVVKAWCTDVGVEVTNIALQTFGGAGYIEETGVAQHLRDARIAPIYEGTNGIQAMDLVRRKLPQTLATSYAALVADMARTCRRIARTDSLDGLHGPFSAALVALEAASDAVSLAAPDDAAAAATPYLRMFGTVSAAWLLARQAITASSRLGEGSGDADFLKAKISTARFFIQQILPQAEALLPAVRAGHEALVHADAEWER